MNTIDFKFCSFEENIITLVISEQPVANTIFVFPTEISKKQAIKEFQQKWTFSQTFFLTMAELKERLFFSERPVLKEEKRTLAFYAVLSADDKKFFKINNYFQAIELANHFFNLWEEFNEEIVNDRIDKEKFARYDVEILDWQLKTYDRLVALKKSYQQFINSKGFDDIIYLFKPENINFQTIETVTRIVFVNQFYYTGLEKEIIKKLTDLEKTVVIYYQLPASLVEPNSLEVKPFSLKDLGNYHTRKIHISESKNNFSMIASLLEHVHRQQIHQIVDIAFFQNPYSLFLSLAKFNVMTSVCCTHTTIFRFLTTLHNLVDEIIWEPVRKKFLLPLQVILDAVLIDDFFFYFVRVNKVVEQQRVRTRTLEYIYSLIERDYKYIDLDLEVFKIITAGPGAAEIQTIVEFLQSFINIKNIGDLVALVDHFIGFQVKNIISGQEYLYSNILDRFYRMVSDFATIENPGIVENWSSYFSAQNPQIKPVKLASGILRLFIDYLKSRYVSYNYKINHNQTSRVEIAGLLDTRNINYSSLAVLNVIDGKIPHARQAPFLFTEKQRKLLNLKTYEDIKLREKYYFFRLILTCPNVFLFAQKNIEQNVEVSSFVEEIKLYFPREQLVSTSVKDQHYGDIYREFLHCLPDYSVEPGRGRNPAFFQIPVDLQRDVTGNNLDLNPYTLKELQENPFVFYIHQLIGLQERHKKVDTDFSPKLIGIIVHDFINEAWHHLLENYCGPLFGYDFSLIDQEFIDRAIQKILQRFDYYFRIPHNYTVIYFDEILMPVIRQGVAGFFRFLDNLKLGQKNLVVIPEKDYGHREEKKYKTILTPGDNTLELEIRIRGRADLRIEVPDENQFYIFDYKTGSFDKEQLIIYELFYYLLEHPGLYSRVSSYFFQILTTEAKELRDYYTGNRYKNVTKEYIIAQFKNEIIETVQQIKERGFALPGKKSRLGALPEITRKDLFLAIINTIPVK